jgi:hypothetical protein
MVSPPDSPHSRRYWRAATARRGCGHLCRHRRHGPSVLWLRQAGRRLRLPACQGFEFADRRFGLNPRPRVADSPHAVRPESRSATRRRLVTGGSLVTGFAVTRELVLLGYRGPHHRAPQRAASATARGRGGLRCYWRMCRPARQPSGESPPADQYERGNPIVRSAT